jgi:Ca2+/Na+ antiporter
MSVILFELKRILKSVVQDNPFEKGNSKNLTIIAIALIVGSLIMPLLEGRIVSAIIRVLQISSINFSYSMDCTLLFTGIIILILAGVFQYGNYLQEEVDSTL